MDADLVCNTACRSCVHLQLAHILKQVEQQVVPHTALVGVFCASQVHSCMVLSGPMQQEAVSHLPNPALLLHPCTAAARQTALLCMGLSAACLALCPSITPAQPQLAQGRHTTGCRCQFITVECWSTRKMRRTAYWSRSYVTIRVNCHVPGVAGV